MAYPVEPQRPLNPGPAAAERRESPREALARTFASHPLRVAFALFAASVIAWLAVYVAFAAPGAWFPGAAPRGWAASAMVITRGAARFSTEELIVTAPDPTGLSLISVTTSLRARDFPVIAWSVIDVPQDADVRLLWASDYTPSRLDSVPLTVVSGRTLPVLLAKNPDWIGQITGLALAIRGPLGKPVRVRGVIAKPMGALELVRDRFREWIAFEEWNGTSINAVTGGADVQDLPLPILMMLSACLAFGLWHVVARGTPAGARAPLVVAVLFLLAWSTLDARWIWNLARQTRATIAQYGGKDWREKHVAAEDGPLFEFIEKVRARLPPSGARVFMVADAHYFRGRGSYHLYPHNVYFDPWRNLVPPPALMHAGDYVVVYQRHGMQFDAANGRLRWDGNPPVAAEALLVEPGAALFRLL